VPDVIKGPWQTKPRHDPVPLRLVENDDEPTITHQNRPDLFAALAESQPALPPEPRWRSWLRDVSFRLAVLLLALGCGSIMPLVWDGPNPANWCAASVSWMFGSLLAGLVYLLMQDDW
jgi:hypothetical protein